MLARCTLLIALLPLAMTAQDPIPPSDGPPTTQPTSRPAEREAPPPQQRLFEDLIRDSERQHRILPRVEPGSATPQSLADDANLLPEGLPLRERLGRVVRAGETTTFEFAPDGSGSPPPAMELLPNTLRAMLEDQAAGSEGEFIISAEITRYRGRNYLFLLNFRRNPVHGNLGP